MSSSTAGSKKFVHVIGFGAVGQAFYRLLQKISTVNAASLSSIAHFTFWAPEITEEKDEGFYKFKTIPPVTRETLVGIVDGMKLREGDIVLELATRIDTPTLWEEVKRRGAHFANTGFDCWPDVELDLEGLDELKRHPMFSKPSADGKASQTCIFSFGCNPGIVSHFVRYGLKVATGESDVTIAAEKFGLKSIAFTERDTQWGLPGSAGEAKLESTKTSVLYNTWSPGNYLVETLESTLLYPGIPDAGLKCNAGMVTVLAWVPSGPIVGFMPPHDETFTIQPWFNGKTIPSVFVYEASPTARAYVKSGKAEHSEKATCRLLTPKAYDLAPEGYDMLGALMFSSKEGVAPFYCGIEMNVADAAAIDPTGSAGPTAMQVTGGLWTSLQYILSHPSSGDMFPEDVPSDFVVTSAFPWSGRLVSQSAPQALEVLALYDPGAANVADLLLSGDPHADTVTVKASPLHGEGLFAAKHVIAGGVVHQLSVEGCTASAVDASKLNHSFAPNAFIDRNRTVRALKPIEAGQEVTIDYSLLYSSKDTKEKFVSEGRAVTNWTSLSAQTLHHYLVSVPIDEWLIQEIRGYFSVAH